MTDQEVKKNSFAAWMMCCRPKTWGVALCPVFVGLAFAFFETHTLQWGIALATALLSVLMQAITNMENDAAYTRRKAERSNRKGLPRATSLGLLSISSVEKAILLLAGIVALDTAYLLYQGGWVIVLISICSVVAAYLYMGGPKPLAYTPFSECVCFIFFGLVAVCGTYYLQTKALSFYAVLGGCAVGFLATAVLVVNNYRDINHDASIQRKTLAVVIGKEAASHLYATLIFLPFVVSLVLIALDFSLWPILATLFFIPSSRDLYKRLVSLEGDALNGVLFSTVQLELRFSIALSILIVVSRYI